MRNKNLDLTGFIIRLSMAILKICFKLLEKSKNNILSPPHCPKSKYLGKNVQTKLGAFTFFSSSAFWFSKQNNIILAKFVKFFFCDLSAQIREQRDLPCQTKAHTHTQNMRRRPPTHTTLTRRPFNREFVCLASWR